MSDYNWRADVEASKNMILGGLADRLAAHITAQAAAIDRLTDHLARVGECPPDRDGCETCPVYLDTGYPDDDLVTLAKCWQEWARN